MVAMRGIIAFVILRARKSKLFFGRQWFPWVQHNLWSWWKFNYEVLHSHRPVFFFSFRTLHRTTLLPPSSASAVVQKETGYKPDVSLDSLIQGLIYERQTGNYFQMYLQTTGNKVFLCWCLKLTCFGIGILGLGQTSNFSWDKPNSNLGRPKLS